MITKSIVKKICLSLIGGSPLMPIPTTKVLGSTIVTQIGAGTLSGFASAATEITKSVGSLSSIVQNPVGTILTEVESTVGNLVGDKFSGLDATLSSIAAATDSERIDAYTKLKTALGGGDGIGGVYSEIQKFKKHTDRISGVTVASDSDLSRPLTNPQTPGGR
jgi:hypothetical protein